MVARPFLKSQFLGDVATAPAKEEADEFCRPGSEVRKSPCSPFASTPKRPTLHNGLPRQRPAPAAGHPRRRRIRRLINADPVSFGHPTAVVATAGAAAGPVAVLNWGRSAARGCVVGGESLLSRVPILNQRPPPTRRRRGASVADRLETDVSTMWWCTTQTPRCVLCQPKASLPEPDAMDCTAYLFRAVRVGIGRSNAIARTRNHPKLTAALRGFRGHIDGLDLPSAISFAVIFCAVHISHAVSVCGVYSVQ